MSAEKLEQLQRNRAIEVYIDKQSPEYHAGIHEGRRQERGNWVQVLSSIKEIDEMLLGRIIGEVAKLYET